MKNRRNVSFPTRLLSNRHYLNEVSVEGKKTRKFHFHTPRDENWSEIVKENPTKFNQALNLFIDLIDNNLFKLSEIGISVNEITFWHMYEFEQQCNIEFGPDITKRRFDNTTLCLWFKPNFSNHPPYSSKFLPYVLRIQ